MHFIALLLSSFLGLILGIHGLSDYAVFCLGWLVIVFGTGSLSLAVQSVETPIITCYLKRTILTGHALAFFTFQLGFSGHEFPLPNYVQLVNH